MTHSRRLFGRGVSCALLCACAVLCLLVVFTVQAGSGAAETATTQPAIRRASADPGPGRLDWHPVRPAQRVAVEHVTARDGMRFGHHVLASPGAMATSRSLETTPHRAPQRIAAPWPTRSGARRGRQFFPSRAARGKKLDRTLPIAARPGRSIMFLPTRPGFRSSRRR